jgi:outer membrane lipoprotein SlyB
MTAISSERSPGATAGPRSLFTRNNLLVAAGLSLAGLGLAAGLSWQQPPPVPTPSSPEAVRSSLAANESLVEPGTPQSKPALVAREGKPQQVAQTQATPAKPAAVCKHCGVIESVRAVQKKGEGTGLGAVAGGVVGGVVGNQFGKGSGRSAMTVLGAVGGGVAGNEIEKRSRSTTVYQVQVRMDDGSVRSFERQAALAAGTRVTIEGNQLRVAKARSRAPAQAPSRA